jgi:hypothetical protein
MKIFLVAACTLLLSLSLLAQPAGKTIRGLVKDIQNQPLPGATIQLLRLPDSSVVQTTTAGNNGNFGFTRLNNGAFTLVITAVGHQPYKGMAVTIDEAHTTITLPLIILRQKKPGQLKEVTVVARKPLIEHDIDKTIVNVEAMLTAATGSAYEVLEKTPGVTVDVNGAISLYGQTGVMVLIDGRQTHLSGQDLANYLRSLPGSMLDKIELMPNPPAKYDAAGGAVINIRLKKNKVQGYFGSVTANYSQGITGRSNNTLTLNYNRNKLNLFGSIGYNKDGNYSKETYDRTLYQSTGAKKADVVSQSRYIYGGHAFPVRVGMDYTISPKTTIGMVVNYNSRRSKDNMSYSSSNYNGQGNLDSAGTGFTEGHNTWRQRSLNINGQHAFNKSGRELTTDLNYIRYTNDGWQDLERNLGASSGGKQTNTYLYVLPSQIDVYNAKADYSHPLKHAMSISAGIKWSLVKNDNRNDFYTVINNTPEPDYSQSNHFIYQENINGAYINMRKDWKRFGMQLGLRAEHTNIKGHQAGNSMVDESRFNRDYTGLFPTVFFTYKLDSMGRHTLAVNYARRVNRPGYSQLNPFLFYRDQYTYSTGNPFLNPTYGDNIHLSYRYKQLLNLIFMHNRINDVIIDVARPEGNIFISRPENLAGGYLFAFSANLNWSPVKWWNTNITIAGARFLNRAMIGEEYIKMVQYVSRGDIMSQFRFKKDWSAELTAQYITRMINWQRIVEPRYRLNAGVQKKLLKGKASLKLSVDDIFYWWKDQATYVGLKQATAVQINRPDMRRIGLAFNYNFGKEIFARKRRHTDNAADDVKGRVE